MIDLYFILGILALLVVAIVIVLGLPVFLCLMAAKLCGALAWDWWIVCIPLMVWAAGMVAYIIIRILGRD